MDLANRYQKKMAVVIVNDEIIGNAVKEILGGVGFEVRGDIKSCEGAAVGFVAAYFAVLGVVRQVRTVNHSLPLVLINNTEDALDTEPEYCDSFYDVIKIDHKNAWDIKQKIGRWFSEGRGKFLLK